MPDSITNPPARSVEKEGEAGPQPVIDPLTARDIVDVLIDELVERKVIPYNRWEDFTATDLEELTKMIVKRYEKL